MRNGPDNAIATLRHRRVGSSRAATGGYFDYDPARRLLMGAVRIAGAAPVLLHDGVDDDWRVTLCTERHPRHGSYAVRALDDRTFVVSSAVYDAELLRFRPHPLHPSLPMGSIVLAEAPDDVASDLLALFAPPPAKR